MIAYVIFHNERIFSIILQRVDHGLDFSKSPFCEGGLMKKVSNVELYNNCVFAYRVNGTVVILRWRSSCNTAFW